MGPSVAVVIRSSGAAPGRLLINEKILVPRFVSAIEVAVRYWEGPLLEVPL